MIETNIIGGLERLGGFGGIADRLNSYNHYLGNPDYLQQDMQRYRGVTASTLQTFARDQLAQTGACRHARRARTAGGTAAGRHAAGVAGGGRRGSESINADEPWRNEMPKPGRGADAAAGHAAVGDAAERSDTDPQRAARSADRRRQPGAPDRQRRESARQAGARQLRRGDAGRGHRPRGTRCRSPTKSRSSAPRSASAARWMRRRWPCARCRRTSRRRWICLPTSRCVRHSRREEIERQRASRLAQRSCSSATTRIRSPRR